MIRSAMARASSFIFAMLVSATTVTATQAATVTLQANWPGFPGDNGVTIETVGGVVVAGPLTSSNTTANFGPFTLLDNTKYIVRMTDSFGDGWTGTNPYIQITVDGTALTSGFVDGGQTERTFSFIASPPQNYSAPSFPYTCSGVPVDTAILRGGPGGEIFRTNTLTGGSTLETTSPNVTGGMNAMAANPDAQVHYYAQDSTVYYWDPKLGTGAGAHGVLGNLANFPAFQGGNLQSGGAGYFNGVYFAGSERANGDFDDIYAVVLTADGKSILSVNALNVRAAAIQDGYRFPIDGGFINGFGDLVVLGNGTSGRIYGSTGSLWTYDLTTRDFNIVSSDANWPGGQLAVDGNGVAYRSDGSDLFQMNLSTGATIGGAVDIGGAPVDLTGPFDVSQCAPTDDYSDALADGSNAPDGTVGTSAYGVAIHEATGPRLGASVTTEVSAVLDADNASDDAITTFPTLTAGDVLYTLTPADFNAGSGNGTLYAWIDFDGDGAFEASEFASSPAVNGVPTNNLVFSGFGSTVSASSTYARFRLTTNTLTNAQFATIATDGEVEDYAVPITSVPIYSCTPVFNTEVARNLYFFEFDGVTVGSAATNRTYTLPDGRSVTLTLQKLSGIDVEGVSLGTGRALFPLVNGGENWASIAEPTLRTVANGPASTFRVQFSTPLNIFTADGEASGPAESFQVITTGGVWEQVDGVNQAEYTDFGLGTQTWGMVGSGTPTVYGTGVVISRNTSEITVQINASGGGRTGVVFGVHLPDAGDAPLEYGVAAHEVNNFNPACTAYGTDSLYLGALSPDGEVPAAIHSANADGDETSGGRMNEDDGISAFPTLTGGDTTYTIPAANITAAGTGTLHAWIDFDGDDILETGEYASTTVTGGTVAGDLLWTGQTTTAVGTTFARMRLTSDASVTSATPSSYASDGEVEDYQVTVEVNPVNFSCQAKVDVWYANDESGSVNATEFQQSLDFIYQVSDGFYHSVGDGAQGSIVGWAFDADPTDVVMPLTDTFYDSGDSGLASTGTTLDNDGNGVRENYTAKVSASGGTHLQRATQGLANRINAGNGRRTGVPQVAVILTDAPNTQINNSGNGGTTLWEAAAANLRAAGPDGVRIAVILLAEAAQAYDTDAASKATIDKVVGSTGIVIKTSSYAAAANPVNGFIDQAINDICDSATFPESEDYSDAPADGGTSPNGASTTAYGDATHTVTTGIQLGAAIDIDPASIASANADGDGADDDGVTLPAMTQGQTVTIPVSVTQAAANDGYLQAWIDWNGDGDFDDRVAGLREQIAIDVQSPTAGTSVIDLEVQVPINAVTTAQTFARFRWSTTAGLDNTTAAPDGEVEDYAFTIAAPVAPIIASCTATPRLTGNMYLSSAINNSGGTLTTDLLGTPAMPVSVSPTTGPSGSSFAGLGSGEFRFQHNPSEVDGVISNSFSFAKQSPVRLRVGPNNGLGISRMNNSIDTITFVARGATSGFTWVVNSIQDGTATVSADGLSISIAASTNFDQTQYDVSSNGLLMKMDVTRHSSQITNDNTSFYLDAVTCYDLADAPFGGFAAHSLSNNLRLGGAVDIDIVALTSPNADGDGTDDDGVTFSALPVGGSGTITVSTNGSGGFLQAWIDWDGNGSFDGPVEQIATDMQDFGTGTISIPVTVPAYASAGQTFARFRWSSDFSIGVDGIAIDGEVEDYAVTLGTSVPVLSGRVFLDNGVGALAHDGVVDASETGANLATIALYETAGGTLIANATVDAAGNWSATLPTGFSGEVRLETTPQIGYRTISENVDSLPSPTNVSTTDGTYTFTPAPGASYSGLNIGLIAEPTLTQNQTAAISAGQTVELSHVYTATTTGTVNFALTDIFANPAGTFVSAIFEDANCDGVPEQIMPADKVVNAGDSLCVIVRTQASSGIGSSASYTYGITATTLFNGTGITTVIANQDALGATGGEDVVLEKRVTNITKATPEGTSNTADIGDVLRYRLIVTNPSTGPASDVVIYDQTPAYTALDVAVPTPVVVANGVTCTLNGSVNNVVGYEGPLQWDCSGTLPPGASGSVTFDVRISP